VTDGPAVIALTVAVALLERAVGYTVGGLPPVTPGAMSNPTPCREWDLHAPSSEV
jgi:hypothetical protein